MSQYIEKARTLQRAVIKDEAEFGAEYGEDEVRRSVVHARQDMVLVVSHLSSINDQLTWIRRGIWVLITLAIIFLFILKG
jgi:hypothetical protein